MKRQIRGPRGYFLPLISVNEGVFNTLPIIRVCYLKCLLDSQQLTSGFVMQVYTDWANHYLCRTRSKRLIDDLQTDMCDGILLADIIEAVSKYRLSINSYSLLFLHFLFYCLSFCLHYPIRSFQYFLFLSSSHVHILKHFMQMNREISGQNLILDTDSTD